LVLNPGFPTVYFATDSTGCITDTFFVAMHPPSICDLSVSESVTHNPFISIEPTADNSMLPIHWYGFNDQQVTLVVYSVFGQLITKQVLPNNQTEFNQWELPTVNLAKGSYFIQLSGSQSRAFIQFTHH
jgi:hypothetical protein